MLSIWTGLNFCRFGRDLTPFCQSMAQVLIWSETPLTESIVHEGVFQAKISIKTILAKLLSAIFHSHFKGKKRS